MRDKFHVLTPFSRPENIERIVERLVLHGVVWHPICHNKYHLRLLNSIGDWIEPVFACPPRDRDPCYWKLNYWIGRRQIVEQDMYCFMNDDDGFESQFFPRVRAAFGGPESPDVVFVSMSRGHRSPPRDRHRHPTGDIIAGVEKRMWNQQTIARGYALPTLFYGNYCTADGDSIGALRSFRCRDEPSIFALFNLFEEGRYDNALSPPDWR